MPELPEVETVRLGLAGLVAGKCITDVALRRANLRTPFPAGFAQVLRGQTILGIRRRAKYLLADLSGGQVWLSHLGMSGSFRTYIQGADFTPEKHDHVVLGFADGGRLVFNDPRRFGMMDVFMAADEAQHPYLAHLGLEPLSNAFSGPALLKAFRGRKAPVKGALMDQRLVVGVGNIYASESLFMAGIHPARPAGSLREDEADALSHAVITVLRAALKSGGSTLRDHRQLDGNTGYFQHSFQVYGHKGLPCPCGLGKPHVIQAMAQGGRTTFFCPVKQR